MSKPTLFPEWKQAVHDFFVAGFKDGDLVSKEWLEEHFEMKPVVAAMTHEQFTTRQFEWLRNMESFKESLLNDHQIFLETVHGSGYRVVPPAEQTYIAMEKFKREATKAFRRSAETLSNVKLGQLTDAERRENRDAIAKLSMLRGMQKGALLEED